MMADVIGVPVIASAVQEASSRGAAMLAFEAFGVIKNLEAVDTPLGEVFRPDERKFEAYERGRSRQEKFYDLLIENAD